MRKSYKYLLSGLAFCLFNLSCSSGGSDDGGTDPGPTKVDPPSAATLAFPEQNTECTEGSNLTSTESTITFNWNDSHNTDSYQLFVKNLDSQSTLNYATTVSEKSVTILRGTPYSWYVVSKNSGAETAQSTTWKFYNAGEAVSSYAPFPAERIAPDLSATFNASTTSVTLEWFGEDVDNDIKEYDVYFDTVNSPVNKITTTENTSTAVNVNSGNTYYWSIVTHDNQNNNSESQVFQFTIE